jgi:hypothetical protein
MLVKKPIGANVGAVQPRGALQKMKLNPKAFEALQNEWAIKNKNFDKFRDRYYSYVRQRKRARKSFVPFAEWRPVQKEPNTPEQQRY